MAQFSFEDGSEYALLLKNGANVNFKYEHTDKQGNIVTGFLFASEGSPFIQIDQSEIVSATRIPSKDVEKIKKISQENARRWEEQVDSIGQPHNQGSYV